MLPKARSARGASDRSRPASRQYRRRDDDAMDGAEASERMAAAWGAAASEVSARLVSGASMTRYLHELRRRLGGSGLDCRHARTVLKVEF